MSRNDSVPRTRKCHAREKHDDLQRGGRRDVAKKPRVSTSRRVPRNSVDVSSRPQSKPKKNQPQVPRNSQKSPRKAQGTRLNSSGTSRKQAGHSPHPETTRAKRRVGGGSPRLIILSDNEVRKSTELRDREKRRARRAVRKDTPNLLLLSGEGERNSSSPDKRRGLSSRKSSRTTRSNCNVRKQTKVKFAKHVEIRYIYSK